MRKHLKVSATLLAAAITFSLGSTHPAQAADSELYANYGKIKFGMLQPVSGFDDAGYDTGGSVSAVFGRYLTKNIVIEGSVEYSAAENDFYSSNAVAGSYKQDNTLSSAGYLLTLKGEFPAGPMHFFAGGGIGIYTVTLETDIDSSQLGDLDRDESDSVFGAHVVAGATYDINDRIFIGFEGMYRWTGDVDIDERVAGIPVQYSADLNGYLLTCTAGFRF